MTDESVAISAPEYYAKRVRYYLAQRGLDEQVVSVVPMYPAGLMRAKFAKDMGGLLGTVAGSGSNEGMMIGRNVGRMVGAQADRLQGGGVVRSSIKIPKRCQLVMTDTRLLVFSLYRLGFFSSKPKKDAAVDVPLTEIVWVSEPTTTSGGYTKLLRVDVCVRDRGFLHMEFPLPSFGPTRGVAFAAELHRRVGLLDAPPR